MKQEPKIIILSGGIGPERDVSLRSGQALFDSLSKSFSTQLYDLRDKNLPESLSSDTDVVFPIIHGEFGEDGELQKLLDAGGFEYCGCDASSSRLCMNKSLTKTRVAQVGVRTPKGIDFNNPQELDADDILTALGDDLIIKPTDQGSSVSLFFTSGRKQLVQRLQNLDPGNWLIERRVIGREVTIGVLNNDSLGIVEVIPIGGVYDYERKYTPGSTEYRFPAIIDSDTEVEIKESALKAYQSCGCRDFARVDFIICDDGHAHFLEINTLPGLTQTSLLPKSASSSGYSFDQLTKRLVMPAVDRFNMLSTNDAPCAA
jgi:D-alanine-D-alanine ligase